jgi:hypothetical protein
MRKIQGNYFKNGDVVDFDFMMPGSWEELTPFQTASILQTLTYNRADPYTLRVSLLLLIAGEKNYNIIENLPDEDIAVLATLIEWVYNTRPSAINKFPKIKTKKKIYIAPADSLDNLCFGEWCFAYEFYKLYCDTGEKEYLNKLIATLYREVIPGVTPESINYNGDLRYPFNENLIDVRSKYISFIEAHWKLAILTWFTSALIVQMDRRPHVFPKTSAPEENEAPINQPENVRTWLTVFRELIGPKFGTTEQLKYTNAMFVLDYLEEQHIAYEEAKSATTH